jgi:hypothetical protein
LKQPSASLLSRELFSVHLASHVIFAECVWSIMDAIFCPFRIIRKNW